MILIIVGRAGSQEEEQEEQEEKEEEKEELKDEDKGRAILFAFCLCNVCFFVSALLFIYMAGIFHDRKFILWQNSGAAFFCCA